MDREKIEKLLGIVSGLATDIRNDWSDPRWECREIWEGVSHLREQLLGADPTYRHVKDRTVDKYIEDHTARE